MKTIQYALSDGVATLTFDEPDSPVNTMCQQWQLDLSEAVAKVLQDRPAIKGVILASNKTTFFAGADLKATMALKPEQVVEVYSDIELVKKNFRALETLGIPVVTCLNGTALGGGWELALVGHHRIAVNNPKIQFGLPEVTLGLIPGASGITKMTRLLGLLGAQPYLLEGKLFNPAEAMALGLVHELVDDPEQLRGKALEFIAANPQSIQPWDAKDYKIPGGTPSHPKIAAALSVAPAILKLKTRGLYPAPEAALCAMTEGAQVDLDTALRIESRYLAKVMVGPVAKNMINAFFFDLSAVKSGQSRPRDVPKYKPKKVGVLGAGMMGAGIAYAQAARGIATILKDVSLEKADSGKAYSARLTQARVDKKSMTAQAQTALLDCITTTTEAGALSGCDLIIEAVFEQRELKATVTREVESQLAAGGIFASNTSTLQISGLALASTNPKKFIGIHFFSPVEKMQLVEIIRGQQTDDETVARAFDYVQALGKIPIVVNDSRGFYTSRTFGTFVMEGAAMLGEGIPAPVIEQAALQAGMPVGPLAVLDETSLTLSVHVLDQTRADCLIEGKTYHASQGELLVERMVKELKRGGRAAAATGNPATGGGFYNYPAGSKKALWPELKTLFEKPDMRFDMEHLKDRLLYRQAIETARCLHEGVLTSVADANIGSIFGIGFPAWTGGALQFIYAMGIDAFAKKAEALSAANGSAFAVSQDVIATLKKFQPA
jgi:3-hydroxyacyl-CoA dehydrogenase / enoyl-CoA hydratase / 3-hydroxybutyryl-CoA epimerase